MIDTLLPSGPRMGKKQPKPQGTASSRFKPGNVPADKRRATLLIANIRTRAQEIRDELAKIDQLLTSAEELGAASLYLDGATKADTAAVQLMIFRQKMERAVLDLSRNA